MICHEFKGGTGTASRVVRAAGETFTVGGLVQANYGARELLRVDGVPVGRAIGRDVAPSARAEPVEAGSIIVVLGNRCAAAAGPVPAAGAAGDGGVRRGSAGSANGSGDIFLAFATGNHVRHDEAIATVRMVSPDAMTPLFQAAAEATEEAILNALTGAETMTGLHGRTAHALPLERLVEVAGGGGSSQRPLSLGGRGAGQRPASSSSMPRSVGR